MKKAKIIFSTGILFFIIFILSFWIINSNYKTDFNEYQSLTKNNENKIVVNNKNKKATQDFKANYPILKGISMNTFSKINSNYILKIKDLTNNEEIIKMKFNNKNQLVKTNKIMLNFKKPITINNKHKLSLEISKTDNTLEQLSFIPDKDIDLYGGESRGFWKIFPITISLIILSFSIYGYYLSIKNKNPLKNKPFQAFLVGLIAFSMLYIFKECNVFLDETDYILSGIRLTQGARLYSDYLSQHMPFQAFLVAILHKIFLAFSTAQFRLCWFAIMGTVYAFIYYRYSKAFGNIKMFLLPIIHILVSFAIPGNFIWFIADEIEMLALLILLLEFICYWQDGKLKTSRIILISSCIFISFNSIFASVYNIFIIFIGFIIKEIKLQKEDKKSSKQLFKRYFKLSIIIAIPFIILLLYFILTKSLSSFIEQAYTYNREVYPKYAVEIATKNFGKNVLQPFYTGPLNMIKAIFTAHKDCIIREVITMIAIILAFFYSTIKNLKEDKNNRILIIIIFAFATLLFSRSGISFHTLPGYIIVLSILILNTKFTRKEIINNVFLSLIVLISIITYCLELTNTITSDNIRYIEDEKILIDNSKSGDTIFLDIFSLTSLYPSYKNRIIVNQNVFTLPWFMEVYQDDQIKDLKAKKPKFVIYNYQYAKKGVRGKKNYDLDLRKYINENYTQIDGSMIYKRTKE